MCVNRCTVADKRREARVATGALGGMANITDSAKLVGMLSHFMGEAR